MILRHFITTIQEYFFRRSEIRDMKLFIGLESPLKIQRSRDYTTKFSTIQLNRKTQRANKLNSEHLEKDKPFNANINRSSSSN